VLYLCVLIWCFLLHMVYFSYYSVRLHQYYCYDSRNCDACVFDAMNLAVGAFHEL